MRRVLLGVAASVLAISLSACGGEASEPGTNETGMTDTGYGEGHIVPDNSYYVKKFTLDGTTCVIFKDDAAGGLACDFTNEANTGSEFSQ